MEVKSNGSIKMLKEKDMEGMEGKWNLRRKIPISDCLRKCTSTDI